MAGQPSLAHRPQAKPAISTWPAHVLRRGRPAPGGEDDCRRAGGRSAAAGIHALAAGQLALPARRRSRAGWFPVSRRAAATWSECADGTDHRIHIDITAALLDDRAAAAGAHPTARNPSDGSAASDSPACCRSNSRLQQEGPEDDFRRVSTSPGEPQPSGAARG